MCDRRLALGAAAIAAIRWCASTEIIPHWRVDPISPAAIQAKPALAAWTR